MSLTRSILFSRVGVCRSARCLFSSKAGETDSTTGTPPPKQPEATQESKAAPSDNSKYGSEMYYTYNDMSFYDIEMAMAEKRVGQPSSKQK